MRSMATTIRTVSTTLARSNLWDQKLFWKIDLYDPDLKAGFK